MKPHTGCRLLLWLLISGLGLLLQSGCQTAHPAAGLGTRIPRKIVLPAHIVSNFFFIETGQDDGKTYRFLVDTGSSATLVSTDLAAALRLKEKGPKRTTRVRGARGGDIDLEVATLKLLQLGDAAFDRVPVLIYNFTDLSSHLGLQVDGVIGFPLFRHAQVTLDYPAQQLVITPPPSRNPSASREPGGTTLTFTHEQGTPFIPLQMGNESFSALIDSGSDAGLSLNPAGLHPKFTQPPRAGTLITTLTGDYRQLVGRLEQNLLLGSQTISRPIVDLTEQISSIGGEFLRHFAVTFDPSHNQVTFARADSEPLVMAPRRSTGISFSRFDPYWRVVTIVPDSPAANSGVQAGDICVRINGEPVSHWDFDRYTALVKTARKITYTFLNGAQERDVETPVFDLVP